MNNDALRDFLPYMRPRSAEPTALTIGTMILIGLAIVALSVLAFLRWRRAQEKKREQFCLQAQEQGLEPAQIELLLQLAHHQKMRSPELLLSSAYTFERHVDQYSDELAARQPLDPLLEEIARIRVALGFHHLPVDQPLRSTHHLENGQTLMVWPAASPVQWPSPWIVVEQSERALTIVPLLQEDQRQVLSMQTGDSLAVHFWREHDTEYRFTTRILEIAPNYQELLLAHTSQVERLQLREFFRLDIHFPILLYAIPEEKAELLKPEEGGSQTEETQAELPAVDLATAPRLSGQVLNLSAGGLGLMTHDPVPAAPLLFVDPEFAGDFPLAGLVCQVVHQSRSPEGTYLQLKFENLPPELEKEIVHRLFEEQTRMPAATRHEPEEPAADRQDHSQGRG